MRRVFLVFEPFVVHGRLRFFAPEELNQLIFDTSVKARARTTPVTDPLPTPSNSRQQGLGYLIRLAHRAFQQTLADRLERHAITASQWTVLRALWDEDNYSQVDLARRIHVEKASLTPVLEALERRGLVRRRQSLNDRRVWNVELTKVGRQLRKGLLPYATQVNTLASEGLSKTEIDTFRHVLQKLIANLSRDAPDPEGGHSNQADLP
jgi:DNA-binding MarR family transcriptional regulator